MSVVVLELVSVFLAGMLAGAEFLVRYGVRAPLAALEPHAHIRLRQALVLRLRVLIPALLLPALVSGLAVACVGGRGPGFACRYGGALALCAFMLVTLVGTVPINKAVLDWQLDAPPGDWMETIDRWERLNTVRCWAAVTAFALFLTALALQLSVRQ